jgi:hypothetical protein
MFYIPQKSDKEGDCGATWSSLMIYAYNGPSTEDGFTKNLEAVKKNITTPID